MSDFAQERCFTYIVVGAGSSGCALAGRLAELMPSAKIALLETGTTEATEPSIADPASWPSNLGGSADHSYVTAPQSQLNNRTIGYCRGKGLGGSSLLNVMLYSRGFRTDWDAMPNGHEHTI